VKQHVVTPTTETAKNIHTITPPLGDPKKLVS
jgi:hypothetical protein